MPQRRRPNKLYDTSGEANDPFYKGFPSPTEPSRVLVLFSLVNKNGSSVNFRSKSIQKSIFFIKTFIIFITVIQPPVQQAIRISFKQLQEVSEATNPSFTRQLVDNFVIF